MNLIKKKKKINILSSQKLKKRKQFKNKKHNINIFFLILILLKNLFFIPFKLLGFLAGFFKKGLILLYCLSVFIIIFVFLSTQNYLKETYYGRKLPSQIQINIDNPQIAKNVLSEVINTLETAKKRNESRSQFLQELNTLFSSFDTIDQYWLRTGLDNVLQISATLQVPILMISSKNNEKYVISNRMKIIAKNPPPTQYPSLLNVEIPDLKINWRSKNTGETHINFPWLVKQINIINNQVESLGAGYSLKKISWTSNGGFVVFINEKQDFVVLLGNEAISRKITLLPSLIETLKAKNISPSEIDLDYRDKAIVKII